MRASFTAIVASFLALGVTAAPGGGYGGNPTPTSTWGSTSPTGAPSCAAGGKYTCKSNGLLTILSCTNVLNGVIVSVPITVLKERDVEARTESKDGDYCCTSSGLLTLSCLNVANGLVVSLPITV